jgi:polyferredoxin
LHIAYDTERAGECAGCNYCVSACFVDLDPRKTEVYDSCINCGECIDACNRIHTKTGGQGLLRFEFGQRTQSKVREFRDNTMSLLSRFGWTAPFALLGATMFAWGVANYVPYHLSVGRMESPLTQSFGDYRIAIASKRYRPTELSVHVEGLPASAYRLSAEQVALDSVGHTQITLSISPELPRGIYPVVVEVRARDGWVGHFKIQHLAS